MHPLMTLELARERIGELRATAERRRRARPRGAPREVASAVRLLTHLVATTTGV